MTGEPDLLVQETLERQVPLRNSARGDWADVLRRAEVVSVIRDGRLQQRPVRRRGATQRLAVSSALAAVVALAAAFSSSQLDSAGVALDQQPLVLR